MSESAKDQIISVTMPICSLLFAVTFSSLAFLVRQVDKRVDHLSRDVLSLEKRMDEFAQAGWRLHRWGDHPENNRS